MSPLKQSTKLPIIHDDQKLVKSFIIQMHKIVNTFKYTLKIQNKTFLIKLQTTTKMFTL